MIGVPGPAPAGQIVLGIAGGRLLLDPADPAAVPACEVSDPPVALPGVGALYGKLVMQAAKRLLNDDQAAEASTRLVPTAELDLARRLGGVRWCRQYSPLALDDGLLRLEELVLAGRLADVVQSDPDWRDDLARTCGVLARRTELSGPSLEEQPPSPVGQPLDGVPGRRRTHRHQGLEDPTTAVHRLLSDAAELLASRPARSRPSSSLRRRAAGTPLLGPEPVQEPAELRFDEVSLFTGADSVDWADVLRGTTSFEEDNVHWAAMLRGGELAFEVGVDGPPEVRTFGQREPEVESPPVDTLAFDVYSTGWPYPVLSGDLFFDRDNWSWVGSARGSVGQARMLEKVIWEQQRVFVRVRTDCPSPASSRLRAEAHRWASRGLALSRLPEPSPRTVRRSALAWRRSAELWTQAEDPARSKASMIASRTVFGEAPSAGPTVAELWFNHTREGGQESATARRP